ncbi:MAG: DNA repair protein RecN [Chloroflexi bacterium]|nr:DNA repair protein RecN [Chloroflexota bacterium]MBM3174358.1 DNA repair protein RecN [Chloroflexota bacterium]MBM4450963.1 DNA repair protein RecN [Chloroflexota bacterium]
MLLELKVRNLGIIESIDWSLRGGLNVITGETGAGKSLVIDAVETLLEGKADEEVIRHGSDEARIEGVFSLPSKKNARQLRDFLVEKGIDVSEDSLVISCDLKRQGRSVIRINGNAVPRAVLHQIGRLLIDIHGQSEHLSLYDRKYHLEFLDAYAHTTELRNSFSAKAAELAKMEQELKSLAEEEKDRARREEFLRFQLDEISRAKLRDGEEVELEQERNVLASAEKLKALSYEAYQALYRDDSSGASAPALDRMNEAMTALRRLVELDPSLSQQLSYLEETVYGLEEAAREIRSYGERLEHSPQRQEEVESRLELIRTLKRKYGQNIADVLSYAQKAEKELENITHSTERREELEQAGKGLKAEMGQMAAELSQARSGAARKLVAEVRKELHDLSMSQVEFQVSIAQQEAEGGIPLPDGKNYAFSNEGVDVVEFLASTNPGEPLKPLSRIASTGEISRFTLALKGALSEADKTPILIFDEIDIGVGGRSGEIIGKKLWALAQNRQVVCVTHLPQIAAFADAHYNVHKDEMGSRTVSHLQALEGEPRIREIAIMLAGPQYTETSLTDAREVMGKAEAWKRSKQSKS